jgi:hypothetical protein
MKKFYVCSLALIFCSYAYTAQTVDTRRKQPYSAPVPEELVTQEPVSMSKQSTHTITNSITRKDIGYSYLFAKRYPDVFTIKVNGKELKFGESTDISSDTFEGSYYYEWHAPWKVYSGSGSKQYRAKPGIHTLQIKFLDWHNPDRIQISNAELLKDTNKTEADTQSTKKESRRSRKRHGK